MRRLASVLASVALLSGCTGNDLTVRVEGGLVRGVPTETEGVCVFRGIPYAAAPVGELRWKAPQPVTPWKGVRMADTFGNAAYQAAHVPGDFYQKEFFDEGDAPYSEDCLFLNVWAPSSLDSEAKLPVAMWIHGGAYSGGWGFEKEMDGEAWAERGVILVTINYRLGMFGYFAHPALSAESPDGVSGNYGLLDQIAALKWVRNNISAFGGDPSNIMVFGQSAGAGSVQALVTSPLSRDLMSKAIIQSGGGVSERAPLTFGTLANAETLGKEIMDLAGLDSIEKMRAASTEEVFSSLGSYLREARKFVMLSPVVDGHVLTETFNDAALGGRVADIPYMIGGTLDDPRALGDMEAICRFCTLDPGRRYAYQFARRLPGDDAGAFHSSELWYVFHTLGRCWREFSPISDEILSLEMVDAWTDFAKCSNPGWAPCTPDSPGYKVFDIVE